jgi:hypothetical protein
MTSFFDVQGSVHREFIFQYNQQAATLHNSFISAKYSTCFRRFLRTSSGAQKLYIQHLVFVKLLLLAFTVMDEMEPNFSSSTTAKGSSNGLKDARFCMYSFELLMMGGGTE